MTIEAWDEIHGAKSQETMQTFLDHATDSYAILQLKHVDETLPNRYMNYHWLEINGNQPEIDHYSVVYTDTLPSGVTLEDLYLKFNLDRPEDFQGHSMSVSDIVALKQQGVVTFHYVDSVGFRELPDFMRREQYLRNAEMSMEDDYDMVGDGIINNGRRDDEKERPSVLAQLKELKETTSPELISRSARDISDREL